jgi:5-methylcytosine-specific restriction endonuclease McrA
MDHIIPLCAGGPDSIENLQWLTKDDHKIKTRVDLRLCRSMKK